MSSQFEDLVPVLMLVPYFAPQTHAAMFRAHKLAKYLPEHGYRPVVVTTDINYLYNEDLGLLNELPECVQVHRARHIEPTVRGLRMALGGRDRTFAALKRQGAYGQDGTAKGATGPATRSRLLPMAEVVRVLGEWPDRYWTWARAAKTLCERLIREQEIKLVYTSASPLSPLRLAQGLQRGYGLRWIADFRDPVGYGQKHSAKGALAFAMERKILFDAMRSADSVVGLADAYGPIFFDLYGLPESRYHFIPTGLDEAYLEPDAASPADASAFVHIGEVMPNQSAHVFAVLQRAHALRPEAMSRFRLEFIGRKEINQPRVQALVADLPDWPYQTTFIDHVPQREVYRRIQAAAACLLVPGHRRYWWNNFAKMVDYIALGVPVIADVPPVSEARNELGRAGNGFFLGGEDIDRDAQALLDWVQAGLPVQRDDEYRGRYTARRQAGAFARLFAQQLDEAAGR